MSQKSETVAEFRRCLAVFGDSRTILRQCGQGLSAQQATKNSNVRQTTQNTTQQRWHSIWWLHKLAAAIQDLHLYANVKKKLPF